MAKEIAVRKQNGSSMTSLAEPFVSLRDAMNRLFEDSYIWPSRLIHRDLFGMFSPLPLDMYETADEIIVKAALPGVKPEETDIQVVGDQLVIQTHVREPKTENVTYWYRELVPGQYRRTIALPSQVKTDKVEATFENGLLTIRLPKVEEAKPKKIQIKNISK